MRPKIRETFLFVCTPLILLVSFSLYLSRDVVVVIHPAIKEIFNTTPPSSPPSLRTTTDYNANNLHHPNFSIGDNRDHSVISVPLAVTPLENPIKSVSILFPDWEVIVFVDIHDNNQFLSHDKYSCLYNTNEISPAKFSGFLQFSNQTIFKCILPNRARRFLPYFNPILTKSPESDKAIMSQSLPEIMFRWRFVAYESLTTETDVIVFAKGVNSRQGMSRPPADLRCIFTTGGNDSIKTAVTSSVQEVFRCLKPNLPESPTDEKIKVSIEIGDQEKKVVSSVAYYTPTQLNVASDEKKALLCACTMVYNVAKFLKEWVIYHSKIGVEKFILYDNESDDNLEEVISKLLEENYDVKKIRWPWAKTQEAGFSHCAMYAKDSCTWMMYIDVDEFIFSPSWLHAKTPSTRMLRSFLPKSSSNHRSTSSIASNSRSILTRRSSHHQQVGQIWINCLEFGPSNQQSHPVRGVTQGYTCRRRMEARHKSIVLLEAIDTSLANVIHHFELKQGYRMKKVSMEEGVVNHYKYQAWSEFKLKFRRRVSAYVVDWREGVNPASKDRTPGLGFEPVEPEGWGDRFCDVHDNRLKLATQRWFGSDSSSNYKMAWQDE